MRRVLLALLVLLTACPGDDGPDPVLLNDAGDAAFVDRAVRLLWGRRPTSRAERDVLVAFIQQTDRAAVVRGMAKTPDYVDRWQDFLYDALAVNRNGDRSNSLCYRIGYWDDDPALAAFVASASPEDGGVAAWTMRDLTRSALLLDDVSPLFRAALYPNAAMPGVPPNLLEAEADRRDFATVFLSTHLGRTPDCLPCHHSQGSVTDAAEPEVDRFWPLPGAPELETFGASEGGDLDQLGVFFRRHGVAKDFVIDSVGFGDAYPPIDLAGGAVPEGFDGCAALENAPEGGCGGCACEQAVCSVDAACCEDRWDAFCAAACVDHLGGECAFHREPGASDPFMPWNMHDGCGVFVGPAFVEDDPAGRSGWFAGDRGPTSSVHALEGALHEGMTALARDGFTGAEEGTAAAAAMIAARLADRVWAEAFGRPLTISHGFPRNAEQRERLLRLTETLVDGGWSLVDVLVEVTTDPLFNQPLPAAADAETTYYFPPVVDPWSIEAEDEVQRGNGLGDLVHRPDPRVLTRAARAALGWRPPEGFPITTASFHGDFQTRTGSYMTWSEPGFEGIDFQWLSAWEARMRTCEEPSWRLVGGGCEADPEQVGCPGCDCFAGVCEERPQCCNGPWDAACAESCRRFNACPIDESAGPDWIDGLLDVAAAEGADHRRVVATLKDRLVGHADIADPDEQALLEELLGPLDAATTRDDEGGLRAVCGALLTSPEFLFVGLPAPASSQPLVALPGESFTERCEALATWMFPGGTDCRR